MLYCAGSDYGDGVHSIYRQVWQEPQSLALKLQECFPCVKLVSRSFPGRDRVQVILRVSCRHFVERLHEVLLTGIVE